MKKLFNLSAGLAMAVMPLLTPKAPAADGPYKLQMVALECITTEDYTGPDEAVLKVNGIHRWGPVSINDGESKDLRGTRPFTFQDRAVISLIDEDSPDPDDFLGSHAAYASEVDQGEHDAFFDGDGARYRRIYYVTR